MSSKHIPAVFSDAHSKIHIIENIMKNSKEDILSMSFFGLFKNYTITIIFNVLIYQTAVVQFHEFFAFTISLFL